MTAVGVLCRLFAGESRTDPTIKRGVDILMQETPRWLEQDGRRLSRINMYHWYYASYAMFQFGGGLWKKWNTDLIAALKGSQRQKVDPETKQPLDEDGSWDPIGEWGLAGGRVYATAIGALTLLAPGRYPTWHEVGSLPPLRARALELLQTVANDDASWVVRTTAVVAAARVRKARSKLGIDSR